LTIAANAQTKVYGTSDPTLTYAYAGLVNGDQASVITGALTRTSGENVGSYAIAQGTLAAGGNYTIAYTGSSLAITPASLTIAANAQTKVYGTSDPTLTYAYAGLVNGDQASVITGALTRTSGENVGSYAIGQGTLAAGGNYTIAYTGANLAITPASLTIAAQDATVAYGSALPPLTVGYTGFVAGDSAASLTVTPTVSSSISTIAGTGTFAGVLNASGAVASNYDIRYVAGALTITASTASVSSATVLSNVYADAQSRTAPTQPTSLSYSFRQTLTTTTSSPAAPAVAPSETGDIATFAVSPDAQPAATPTQTTTSTTIEGTISFAPGSFDVIAASGGSLKQQADATSACPAGVAVTALAGVPYSCNVPISR
ncbi:MAG: MBG domain-containing protein, partial [Ancalomicrobiaceae bacterium]|nr:MBG domain-containing protein [Ancalomicrobiaceae bacterium]